MDFGHVLSSSPPIAENIFKHLNNRELTACAQVCNLWKGLVRIEKNRRKDIHHFFEVYNCQVHREIHSRPCNYFDVEPWEINQDMEIGLQQQLFETQSDPQFCLAFASELAVNYALALFPKIDYNSLPPEKKQRGKVNCRKRQFLQAVADHLFRHNLPEKCHLAFCVSTGVIGPHLNMQPLEIEESAAVTGLLFPKLPGVDIYNFSLDTLPKNISDLIPVHKKLKCLLIFLSKQTSVTTEILNHFVVREKGNLAMGGAIIERSEYLRGFGIALTGDNVQAASVVLGPLVNSVEAVEKKLKVFKDSGLLGNRCIAFMFACVARGHHIYGEHNVESSLFHKMYPGIPLHGIFGNGEIGNNYTPGGSTDSKVTCVSNYVKRCTKRWLHGYTTVFVLISFKE